MALSAFADQTQPPDAAALAEMLGPAAKPWQTLAAHVASSWPPIEERWNFAGAKFGWSLRLLQKKRIVVYLTPGAGHFLVGVVLGDRAVAAARAAGLPPAVLALLDAAKRYGEGTGLRVEVRRTADLAAIRTLLAAKMAP
jgi:hypothetical protein